MNDAAPLRGDALLAFHRELVATPSLSGDEAAAAALVASRLGPPGVRVERFGNSVLALAGAGPLLLLDTHLDTVPPAPGWTREPFAATVEGDRVYGLGANDAKAAVASMTSAFLALAQEQLGLTLGLALVACEETDNRGTRDVLAGLAEMGHEVAFALVGEPTALDFAVAQKGLLVLELTARGEAAHAAHAAALGAPNAALALAHDLVRLDGLALGPDDPLLGAATLTPTVVRAGTARNVVPAAASAILDVRTTPACPPARVLEEVRKRIASDLEVLSDRFAPRAAQCDGPLLAALERARPQARRYGSATLSDWALLPATADVVKVGPGRSERSHTPDEFVLAGEILDGAAFFEHAVRTVAELCSMTFPAAGSPA